MWTPRESINDNLENFTETLYQGLEQEHYSEAYFVSKLTDKEKKLFAEKDEKHMATYLSGDRADVQFGLHRAKSKQPMLSYWPGEMAFHLISNSSY